MSDNLHLLTAAQKEAYDLYASGVAQRPAAERLGISRTAYRFRIDGALRVLEMSPADAERLRGNGVGDLARVHSTWQHNDGVDVEGRKVRGDSVYVMFEKPRVEAQATLDVMFDEIIDAMKEHAPKYAAVSDTADDNPDMFSDHLLVVDPADVHIGKLCAKTEVGVVYNRETAVKRMVEGSMRLVKKAAIFGVRRVVLVIGNDILHADRWNNTTTAGTPQDVDGLWHEWFQDALAAYVALIDQLGARWPVDLVYTPSNHDWQSGYYLAQTLKAWYRNHPNVNFSDYYSSPVHRKYYMYNGGLFGFTHGDGAKEADLANLMQHEQRAFWGQSQFAYWYIHHTHHKTRKRYGMDPGQLEKDRIGVTMISPNSGSPVDNVDVETVRSPSAPDGWHHRNGLVNMQAVEVFLHDGSGAQVGRLTEWF